MKDLHEALQSPQLAFRKMRVEFKPGPDPAARCTALGIPVKYANEPGKVVAAAPGLGEHTQQVLEEAGFSPAEIEAIRGR